MQAIFFFLFATVAVISALLVITRRNILHCALFLVLTFFCLAALYVLLQAEFLAAVQVLIYAGSIMVLFLFVILMVQIEQEQLLRQTHRQRPLAILLGALFLAEVILLVISRPVFWAKAPEALPAAAAAKGHTWLFGSILYSRFLFPFEVASLLLLAAMIGAIVLAKKEID